MNHRLVDDIVQFVELFHLAADQLRRDELRDAARDGGDGVAGDDGGGRRFAEAALAVVGFEHDDQVVDGVHRAQGRLERRDERYVHRIQLDGSNFHSDLTPLAESFKLFFIIRYPSAINKGFFYKFRLSPSRERFSASA